MNGMVKRVSKAILDAMDITDSLDGTAAERYARAAIAAMREPTEAMAEMGAVETDSEEDAIECWRAMIDAALKE